jgi:hypothetical protein
MKKLIIALLATSLPLGAAIAASPDKEHPPQKATEEATPEMKNPAGTDKLHPPQKAMDEATPDEKAGASSGESSGTSGSAGAAQTVKAPSWDVRKAGEGVDLKAKSE